MRRLPRWFRERCRHPETAIVSNWLRTRTHIRCQVCGARVEKREKQSV